MYIPVEVRSLLDYQASASEPTQRANGTPLEDDDLWLDTSQSPPVLNVYVSGTYEPTGSGGGGGLVAVDDDGSEVTAAASRLNFGAGLSVTDDGGGAVTIDVGGSAASAYSETVGDGVETSFDIVHSLGTTDVHVMVWDVSGAVPVLSNDAPSSVDVTDANTVTVSYAIAPGTDEYRVTVLSGGGVGSSGGGDPWIVCPADKPPDTPNALDDEFDDDTLDVAWTWLNQGTSTAVEAHGLLKITAQPQAGYNLRGLYKAMPSTPWSMTAKVVANGNWQNYSGAGLFIRDSTSGRLVVWDLRIGNDVGIAEVHYANSPTSFSSAPLTATWFTRGVTYLRVEDDGTNLRFRLSADGISWSTRGTLGRTAWLASADQIGIFGFQEHASTPAEASFYWFRVNWTPDFDPLA